MTEPSGFQVGIGVPTRYEAFVAPIMRPFVASLVSAAVRPGQTLLDVACGTGFATRAAANVIGPSGRIAAIDVNPGMIAEAQRHPISSELTVDWREASAMALPFEDEYFDAVISQQGVQFFPEPSAGLAEMRRVTRAGGRLAVTVWAPIAQSPYFDAQLRIVGKSWDLDPKVIDQAFPADGEDTLSEWARRAGWNNAIVTTVVQEIHLPPLRQFIPDHLGALPWSAPFFALDAARQAKEIARMIEFLSRFVGPDGSASVPTASLLLTATK